VVVLGSEQSLGTLAYLLPNLEQTAASGLIVTDMSVDVIKPPWIGNGSTVASAQTPVKSFGCPSMTLNQTPRFIAWGMGISSLGFGAIGWDPAAPSNSPSILALRRTNYLGCRWLLRQRSRDAGEQRRSEAQYERRRFHDRLRRRFRHAIENAHVKHH